MPQPDTSLNLDDLFSAITASISARFPAFALVDAYPDDRLNLPSPACTIELTELEPAENPGTEQLAVVAIFEAHIVVGFRAPGAKRTVAKMAASLAHHVQGKRWGLPVEPATITSIAPSDFDPDLDQFEVWAVEWRQTIHIGESVWEDGGPLPTQVLASWSPEIGPTHEPSYIPILGSGE